MHRRRRVQGVQGLLRVLVLLAQKPQGWLLRHLARPERRAARQGGTETPLKQAGRSIDPLAQFRIGSRGILDFILQFLGEFLDGGDFLGADFGHFHRRITA
jgi:hypothetical protein